MANQNSPSNGGPAPFTRDTSPFRPEKPERKFNSRELIEKQKNWTSHFSKKPVPSSGNRFNSDPAHFSSISRTTPVTASAAPPAIPQKPNLPVASKSFLNKVVSPSALPTKPTATSPITIPQPAPGETLADHALFRRHASASPPPVSERLSGPSSLGSETACSKTFETLSRENVRSKPQESTVLSSSNLESTSPVTSHPAESIANSSVLLSETEPPSISESSSSLPNVPSHRLSPEKVPSPIRSSNNQNSSTTKTAGLVPTSDDSLVPEDRRDGQTEEVPVTIDDV